MANTKPEATDMEQIELLRAELKAMKAEMKAQTEAVKQELIENQAAKVPAKDPYLEEYVMVQLFKDGARYKDDVYVAVNGENCVIQRGKPVKIKRKFALVLEQSQIQDTYATEIASQFENAYNAKAKELSI